METCNDGNLPGVTFWPVNNMTTTIKVGCEVDYKKKGEEDILVRYSLWKT